MRKIASLFVTAILCSILVFAQNRTVSGVITDLDGKPLPFASVTIKGTKTGTTADADGRFSLKNVSTGTVLVISSVGHNDKEVTIGASDNLSVSLTSIAGGSLSEVIVTTALGIKRKPKEIGYATATVRADQITAGKSPNLAQALSGKVSGLTIANTSASVNASPRITLRGLRSISGDNTALIVLDGVPVPANTINYLNPNDVERVDVMKGGQAATLYGSEGVNGAILITTKKGGQKPEIVFTHTSNIEQLAYLPKNQTSFGSGSAYGASREENFHPAENQQFGGAYDGSMRIIGRTLSDGSYLEIPYSSVPKMRELFWDDGYTGQTDLSYRAGDPNSNVYLSFQNVTTNGIVPGDKFSRNSVRMNAGRTYGKVNLSFDATYAWDHADRTNTDFYFFALNTATWIPTDLFRDWRNNKFGDPSGYYNDYYNNPWWLKDNNRFDTKNQYFNGNFKLTYKVNNDLELVARGAVANTNTILTTTSNTYTFTGFSKTGGFVNGFNNNYDRFLTGTGRFIARTPIAGGIGESENNGNRLTGEVFGTYSKDFGDISLKAIVGGAITSRYSKSIGVSTNGIGVPELYNLANNSSTGLFSGSNSITQQRKIGGFANLTLGYKGWVYLEGAARNDYTSVFSGPDFGFNDPQFTTYGGSISLVVSELVPSLKGGTIDNLKIRASYNKNGNDNLGAYSLQTVYPNAAGFPYSGLVGTTVGNTIVDPNIRPEDVKTAEVGFELGLLKNRVSLEASAYRGKASKQILPASITTATGFTTWLLNAADVTNKGFEVDAKAVVFRNKDWTINASANYSYNTNEVVSIYAAGLTNIEFQAPDALASLNATVGEMFPYLRTTVFERDDQGRIIIDPTDGWPERADARVGQGTTLPRHNLGLGLNVAFKNFTLIANAEYRGGNLIYHDIGTDMTFTGSGAITTIYNRDQFVWPNSVYWDGSKYVPNTNIAVDNYVAIYEGYGDQSFSRGFAGIGEMYMSSGAFWKLRDLSLSYELPRSVMNRIKAVKGISITAFARNLVTILPDDNWYTDPEFSNTNGNSTGINNSLNTPPTRQIGGTLRVTF